MSEMMNYKERYDEIEANNDPTFGHYIAMRELCRELIDELDTCRKQQRSVSFIELDRLRVHKKLVEAFLVEMKKDEHFYILAEWLENELAALEEKDHE